MTNATMASMKKASTYVPGEHYEIADYSEAKVEVPVYRAPSRSTTGRNQGAAAKSLATIGKKKTGAKATEKQVDLITTITRAQIEDVVRFMDTLEMDAEKRETCLADLRTQWKEAAAKAANTTKSEASVLIPKLLAWSAAQKAKKAAERKAAAPAVEPVGDGFYFMDGKVYKVQTSPSTGYSYAKVLVAPEVKGDRGSFKFAAGSIRKLTAEMVLTEAQAKEFGHLYSICCRCGATLTAEDSIERNMGRICYGKMGF